MEFKVPLPSIITPYFQRQSKNTSKIGLCRICGDQARIFNYGTLSCQSCKTFFRRNGYHLNDVRRCMFNKKCQVTKETRHHCTACRLEKCLLMGMIPELIRKEEPKPLRNTLKTKYKTIKKGSESKQTNAHSMISQRNVNESNLVNLTSSDWISISNILHAHTKFSILPESTIKSNENFNDSSETSSEISSIDENMDLFFVSMLLFIYSSPDFRQLKKEEQILLTKRNLYAVVSLQTFILCRETPNLISNDYHHILMKIYGLETVHWLNALSDRFDLDPICFKVMLIIVAFSTNCFIELEYEIENLSTLASIMILRSQNNFAELLWKYLNYRYGFQASVIQHLRIIQILIQLTTNLSHKYSTNVFHRNSVNQCKRKLIHSLLIEEARKIPVWGQDID